MVSGFFLVCQGNISLPPSFTLYSHSLAIDPYSANYPTISFLGLHRTVTELLLLKKDMVLSCIYFTLLEVAT